MMLDYETLRLIWWGLIALLLIGYSVMDGFDLGVGTLLPFIARTDEERRVLINAIGPIWDGNQVWLILGAGAIFAAWPAVYAAAFSGMYAALLIVLFALFLRPVGFDYRSKIDSPIWRAIWDYALCFGGFVPALVIGVAFGNFLQGVPFHFDETLRSHYTGTLFDLLNPFALLAGVVSVAMLCMHGATFLLIKTTGALQQRAWHVARGAALATIGLFVLAGWWIATGIEGYRIVSIIDPNAASTPFGKEVIRETGAWLSNFLMHPWMWLAPMLGLSGALAVLLLGIRRPGWSWLASALSVSGIAATAGLAMFPFVLPSSTHPSHSLLMWDATSSQLTLWLMLIAAVIFIPVILFYTSWVFRVLRGKVTVEQIRENDHAVY
ncbi:MAG: cytochrome d ubiquinol oxidase subunit II [Zetaproteobacteria bacterium]|nr:MAG: cytochrome d ubiquinol oxidase subunit II [Zetaproteobacteria bacterium]